MAKQAKLSKIVVFAMSMFWISMLHAQNSTVSGEEVSSAPDSMTQNSSMATTVNSQVEADNALAQLLAQSGGNPFDSTQGDREPGDLEPGGGQASGVTFDPAQGIKLNFQDADISALVALVAKVTGENFIVDPRVKGKVTLVSGSSVPVDTLYDIFLSVLGTYNFAALPSGGFTKIIPANLVKQNPTPTITEGELPVNEQEITYIVTLEHASVNEILPILRPLLPPTAHIAPHAGSNTLILTDRANNIRRVVSLIERIDKEQQGQVIRVIQIEHADASSLAQIIGQMAGSLNADEAAKGTPVKQTLVQVDEGLNALIIRAPEKDFPVLQALIAELDVERAEESNVHVKFLKHAEAVDLVTILNGIIQDKVAEAEDGKPLAAKISVQADEVGNSLIIRAKQDVYDEMLAVIDELDVRRSQVFIEAIIAEVLERDGEIIGVDWVGSFRNSSGQEITKADPTFQVEDNGFKVGFVNKYVRTLNGLVMPDLGIVLTALREDSNSNVISTPSMLTLDNEEAEIVVGQEVPFLTGSYASTGTDIPSANPFSTIERKEVGLTLRITPQINAGGAIRLEVAQELSRVSATQVEGASDLITDKRTIDTTVLVDDGQIIVLGGLMRTDESDTYERVPILGDIPYLGAAFRKKSKKKDKINMMVFLRPTIVRSPIDLNRTTDERYEYMRTQEEESLPDTRYLLNQRPGVAQSKPEQISPLQASSPELEQAVESPDEVQSER
ncbi:MAG: type II secretion system secretin GspD [Proteobacteria bacterium]|nr:type II secretion system secretin GspD [Pseudomonadota bacterium]